MSRLGIVSTKCLGIAKKSSFSTVKRTFLSEAYQCREAWEKRLDSPLLKKVHKQNLFQEMDWQYSKSGIISAIDADIFINANTKEGFMEDIVDVVYKLRRGPDTANTLHSTHHAVVRILLESGKTDTLLKIISDRHKFGIYPDHFCLNLLMDTFLKQGKCASAARVAVLQMIQEDWENLLTSRLVLYSCHMYLRNLDQAWFANDEIVPPVPEPKEVIKIRVKHIRKPFFDDHFDLKDPMVLVGKTLCMFSSKVGGSDQLATSYYLLGLTLHQKWDQVIDLANKLAAAKKPVHREVLEIAKKYLEPKPVEEPAAEAPKSSRPAKADPAKEAKEAALKAELEVKQTVSELLGGLEASSTNNDLLGEMSLLVKEGVKNQEDKEIDNQKQLYSKWEEARLVGLKKHQEELRKEEILKRVEQQKADLLEKEKEIYFFDNEDKIDLMIESKEEAFSRLEVREKKAPKETKASKDADYVPPQVFKQYK